MHIRQTTYDVVINLKICAYTFTQSVNQSINLFAKSRLLVRQQSIEHNISTILSTNSIIITIIIMLYYNCKQSNTTHVYKEHKETA